LILRDSGCGSDQYERVGRFWIDACSHVRVPPLRKEDEQQGEEEEDVESEKNFTLDVGGDDNNCANGRKVYGR
jgi:hypothetical protein